MITKILRKDLPGAKAGTRVTVYENNRKTSIYMCTPEDEIQDPIAVYIPNSELSEWVEDEGLQRPELNKFYWMVDWNGEVKKMRWGDLLSDEEAFTFGNVFGSEILAAAARDRIRDLLKSIKGNV